MSHSTTGEKLTAAVSALAALLILGAAVTAQQSRNVPSTRLAALESDLRFQLNLAHRLNGEVLTARLADVDRTLEAWRASPQSGDDYRMLVEWLESSIHRSLPGESGELPPTPKFGAEPPPAAIAPTPSTKPRAIAQASPIAKQPVPAKPAPQPIAMAQATPLPEPAPPKPAVEHSVAVPVRPAPAPKLAPPATTRPAAPPATPAALASVKAKPVEINLPELNSRIAGYHHGLRQVEAALVAGRDQLDEERFAEIVGRLEELAGQCQFIHLYYDTLSADERLAVTAPRPLRPTVELVQHELARLERPTDGDVLSAFEAPASGETSPLAARLQAVADQASDRAD